MEPHPLNLEATLERIEPGLAPVDMQTAILSIAVSMKRIADQLHDTCADVRMTQSNSWNITAEIKGVKSAVEALSNNYSGGTSAIFSGVQEIREIKRILEKINETR